jgi:hypothetical protein
MVQSKADILRATSRHEARHGSGSGSGLSGSGLSRFVPSKATMLKGALGAAATAAAVGAVAGVHALSTFNPSYRDPNTSMGPRDKNGLPVISPHWTNPRGAHPAPRPAPKPATAAPAARRVETDGEMSAGVLWFQYLFRFYENGAGDAADEATFNYYKESFSYDKNSGDLALTRDPTMKWQAGQFETPSLKVLRKDSKAKQLDSKTTTVTFVSGDVAVLHGNLDYAGAVFQASSQFNCLEFVSPEYTPEHGVAIYFADPTQGAACAISCAPGTIVRNYFAFESGRNPQRRDRQVENLTAVIKYLSTDWRDMPPTVGRSLVTVTNGYTDSTKAKLTTLNERITKLGPRVPPTGVSSDRESVMGLLSVGVQIGTQVTCTKLATGTLEKPTPWHRVIVPKKGSPVLVTQVYASALSVKHAMNKGDTKKEDWAPFAQLVLDAAYEATLHAAVIYATETNGRKKVVLTALGGDSGNDTQWISAAIVRALKIFRDAGLDVVINEYTPGALGYIRTAILAETEISSLLPQAAPAFGHEYRPVVMYTE